MKVFQIFALVTFWCFVTVSHSTAATDQQTSPANLLTARDSNGLQDIVRSHCGFEVVLVLMKYEGYLG